MPSPLVPLEQIRSSIFASSVAWTGPPRYYVKEPEVGVKRQAAELDSRLTSARGAGHEGGSVTDEWSAGDDVSAAGASAQAEFDRRATGHRERVAASREWVFALAAAGLIGAVVAQLAMPPMGGLVVLLIVLGVIGRAVFVPNTTQAWATGASGELATARALEQLKIEGFVVLHDRRIPGSSANIDHIVIGPPGVAVVESKSYSGRLRVRGDDVYVGGYRKTVQTVEEAKREAQAVAVALAHELEGRGLKVRPILCVHRADLPFFGASPQGVSIVDGRGLVRSLRKAQRRLSPEDVRTLARLANDRLRPASAPAPRIYKDLVPRSSELPASAQPEPSPGSTEDDDRFLPPIRREQLRLAREARARATDQRTYWTSRGLAPGKAPPTIPPQEPEKRSR
jgi:hypothetical protein